jgi:ABC-type amino acid transport substrate-binding protein
MKIECGIMKNLKIIIIASLMLLLCGCGKKSDELVLVTEAGFAPYEFYDNNEIVGVDIAVGNDIANSMNKKLVVKDVAFDSIISELNSGKGDFAAAGMSITEERKKSVDFTIPYVTSNQVVVIKRGSNLTLNEFK